MLSIVRFHIYIPYKVINTENPLSVQSYCDIIDTSRAVLYIPVNYLCYAVLYLWIPFTSLPTPLPPNPPAATNFPVPICLCVLLVHIFRFLHSYSTYLGKINKMYVPFWLSSASKEDYKNILPFDRKVFITNILDLTKVGKLPFQAQLSSPFLG